MKLRTKCVRKEAFIYARDFHENYAYVLTTKFENVTQRDDLEKIRTFARVQLLQLNRVIHCSLSFKLLLPVVVNSTEFTEEKDNIINIIYCVKCPSIRAQRNGIDWMSATLYRLSTRSSLRDIVKFLVHTITLFPLYQVTLIQLNCWGNTQRCMKRPSICDLVDSNRDWTKRHVPSAGGAQLTSRLNY